MGEMWKTESMGSSGWNLVALITGTRVLRALRCDSSTSSAVSSYPYKTYR